MSKQFTSFPEEIKALRKQLGENQGQFGKHFGVSHAAVSDWESGKSEAPYKVLEWALLRSVEEVPASPTKSEEWNGCCAYGKHICTYCGKQEHAKNCPFNNIEGCESR